MMIIGLALFLIGWLLHFPHHHAVEIVGIIVFIIGLALFLFARFRGSQVGPRRYYY